MLSRVDNNIKFINGNLVSNILVNLIIKKFKTGYRQNYFEVKEEWGIHIGLLESM